MPSGPLCRSRSRREYRAFHFQRREFCHNRRIQSFAAALRAELSFSAAISKASRRLRPNLKRGMLPSPRKRLHLGAQSFANAPNCQQ